MSLFIVFIMVLSVLGVALNYGLEDSESVKFKNTKFKQVNNLWVTYKDKEKITITSQPDYLESIQVPDISLSDINKQKIYFTTNPEDAIPRDALLDIQTNIVPKLNSLAIACTQDSELCKDLPLKTCSDASPSNPIIQLQITETPSITFNNNCLLIQSPRDSFTMYVDALILKLHGLE
ncbi:MAG: hypothetical protein CMH63_00840 [Nanoarchaeota archaeon]|jgi:hypothetical protein|nr:hypothetical protein [Nanoarchaeota archaeon]